MEIIRNNLKLQICLALDKCLAKETNDCPDNANCVNQRNGDDYTCVCKDGYYGDGWNCKIIPGMNE